MKNTQFRVLYRKFLFGLIDLELLSPQGDMSKLFGQFAALLIFLSLLLSIGAFAFWGINRDPSLFTAMQAWTIQHFLIVATMLVVGLFAVMSWNSTFPDRRDVMVLAPLPVRVRTLFLARVTAVGTALCATVLLLHMFAGITWPFALSGQQRPQTFPGLTSDPATAPMDAQDMPMFMDGRLAESQMPGGELAPDTGAGLAIGIVKHGERRVFAYGTAKSDSMFQVGTLAKSFTGLVLGDSVARGEVRLDSPVHELLPEGLVRKPVDSEITLLDLATHRSGLPIDPDNIHKGDERDPYPFTHYDVQDLYEFVSRWGVARKSRVRVLDSNVGFGLLGQALAFGSGFSYPDLLRKRVTQPLRLEDTVVIMSPDQQRRSLRGLDRMQRPVDAVALMALAPAADLHSTAADVLTYLDANLHPERFDRTLSEALTQSQLILGERLTGTAFSRTPTQFSIAWTYSKDTATYFYNGETPGQRSRVFFNRKGDFAAVVLANNVSVSSIDIIGEMIRQKLAGEPALRITSVEIPAQEGLTGSLRWFVSYWVTMMAAGVFIFCCVLSLQGWAAQLLPRRLFLRASSWLQLAVFILLVTVAFLQPTLISPASVIAAQQNGLLGWSPSYWFLGLFQQLTGSPALSILARRASTAMVLVVCSTVSAYALSYFRTVRRIVEEPDILPESNGILRLPAFGNSLQTAIVQFSIRTLIRSRRHRVIIAFYLGMGLAITILFLNTGLVKQLSGVVTGDPWREVSLPFLASSILMMVFSVVGTRVAFSMPIDLSANWIFRLTMFRAGAEVLKARRRAMWVLSVLPVWTVWAVVLLANWPFREAAGHLLFLAILGGIFAEFCLHGTTKLPFTCSYLPGKSSFHMTFWAGIALLVLIARGAAMEMRALQGSTPTYFIMLGVLITAAVFGRWRTAMLMNSEVHFDELPDPVIFALDLHPDGVPMDPTAAMASLDRPILPS